VKNTKSVKNRRKVKYATLGEILADAERLADGEIEAMGNWSAGQIFHHLGSTLKASVDGFGDARLPAHIAVMGRLMRPIFLRVPPPPGVKAPPSVANVFAVPNEVSIEEGLALLREQTQRAQQPGAMNAKSPLVGSIGPVKWEMFHCRHAELHMSFLRSK